MSAKLVNKMKSIKSIRTARILKSGEQGATLIETLVALMVLGAIAVAFLSGLATSLKATATVNRHVNADSIAQSQMEALKGAAYVSGPNGYSAAPLPSGEEYSNYSVVIAAAPLHNPDDGIQKLTVTVRHSGIDVTTLAGYKVNR
ncbi:MAG: type II secretion system protein [Chloroflexi bacterium]|nr:type II secretion system protein [Chloroflexota bacterium]